MATKKSIESVETEREKELRKQLEEKDNKINEIMEMVVRLQNSMLNNNNNNNSKEDFINIYKQIPVVSLYNGTLNLRTKPLFENGKTYTFNKFGEVRNIVYEDLKDLINENWGFAIKGYFYIVDEKVVAEAGLSEYYEKIMNKEQIEKMFVCDIEELEISFVNLNNFQKEVFINQLIEKTANDYKFDSNKIDVLSNLCDKDLRSLVKDCKFLKEEIKNLI